MAISLGTWSGQRIVVRFSVKKSVIYFKKINTNASFLSEMLFTLVPLTLPGRVSGLNHFLQKILSNLEKFRFLQVSVELLCQFLQITCLYLSSSFDCEVFRAGRNAPSCLSHQSPCCLAHQLMNICWVKTCVFRRCVGRG